MRYLNLITTAVLAMLLYACEPNISTPDTPFAVEAQQLPMDGNGLLLEETLLDEIMLPIGTKVITDANDPAQIQFELPDGYAFLTLDNATGVPGTMPRETTRKNELNSSNTILGIINSNNDILTVKKVAYQASLSPTGGLDAFFQLDEVIQQINEHYEFIYKHMKRPDFNKIEGGDQAPEGYAFAPVTLYGVSFALVVPDDGSITSFFPDLQLVKTNSCTGTGSCSCEYEKHCILGNCIYTCGGCSKCTLTIN